MVNPSVLESVGALEKGVIIPTCDIAKELKKMDPQDARAAKRKWRKLKRRVIRKMREIGVDDKRITKKVTIYQVRSILREVGKEKLGI